MEEDTDKILSSKWITCQDSFIQGLIEEGKVLINGNNMEREKYKVKDWR